MYNMLSSISNMVGIIGVSLILTAYFLVSTGRVGSQALSYQMLNFCGAWLILFSLMFHWNLSSVVIEISWIIISLVGISRPYIAKLKQAKLNR